MQKSKKRLGDPYLVKIDCISVFGRADISLILPDCLTYYQSELLTTVEGTNLQHKSQCIVSHTLEHK